MVAEVYLLPTATRGALPKWLRVTINDTIRESAAEAREEGRHLKRTMGTDMEDIVALCEGACRNRCHLRLLAK